MVGKLSLKAYRVEERKNVIFVFIGDEEPHDLKLDVQPGFLDDDVAVYPNGENEIVNIFPARFSIATTPIYTIMAVVYM